MAPPAPPVDRAALLRNWKNESDEIDAEIAAVREQNDAENPLVHAKWVAGEDASALGGRLDGLLARAADV